MGYTSDILVNEGIILRLTKVVVNGSLSHKP